MPLLHASPIRYYIGPQLVGTLANAVLYTLEIVTVNLYRRRMKKRKEKAYIKLLVMFNLFVDTIGSFAACAGAYTFCVIYWGNEERAERPHWTLILTVVTNATVAFTVQGFLNYRYWRISGNWFFTLGILILMLFTLACTLHLVVVSANPNRGALDRVHDIRDVSMALAGSVATDIAINSALGWQLLRMQTFNKATKILIRRIMMIAIATGAVTSFVALVILVTFLISPLSRISTCFSLFLGRVYTLTMLYTILHRESLRQKTEVVVDTSHSFHNMTTTEITSVAPARSRPFSSRSDGMIFARREDTLPNSYRSWHSTSEINGSDDLPKRTISCQSDAPYQSKNETAS